MFKTFDTLDQFEDLLRRDLRKLIQERLKRTPVGEKIWHHSPFRGLEAFDYEHAPIFFGRTRAIGAIREALVQQAGGGCAFVLVFGMSGVGKSSLVRAGVLPTITQPGVIEGIGLWRWCVLRPSDVPGDLCDGLAAALLSPPALPELAQAGIDTRALAILLRDAPEMTAMPLGVGTQRAAESVAATEHLLRPPATRLALVVDQLEELFAAEHLSGPQRVAFVRALSALARSGHVWVIATMRSDFYHRCAEIPELVALKAGGGQFDLQPPTAPELAQMIGDPARAAGVRFEERIIGERLDHTLQETAGRDPQALPLLEFILAELYAECSRDRPPDEPQVLTFAAYERLGGLEGALARRAEEVFATLSGPVQDSLPAVLRAVVTIRGEDESVVSRPALRTAVGTVAEQEILVAAFVRARLFVSDRARTGEEALVRVAHEALLRCWPRLVSWVETNREYLRVRARVAVSAARWRKEGRLPELLLLAGKPLSEGEFLLAHHGEEPDPVIVEFVESSRQSAARQAEERRQAFLHEQRQRILLEWQLHAGTVDKLGRLAEEGSGAKAWALLHTFRADKRGWEIAYLAAYLFGHHSLYRTTDEVTIACFTPDGRYVVAGGGFSSRTVFVLDTLTGGEERRLAIPSNEDLSSLAVSADGRLVLGVSKKADAFLWAASTGELLHTLTAPVKELEAGAFSPDGSLVALAGEGSVGLWDTTTGRELGRMPAESEEIRCLEFSPDGLRLAGGGKTGLGRIWNARTREPVCLLQGKKSLEAVNAITWHPDGEVILGACDQGVLKKWDANTGKELRSATATNGAIADIRFDRSGDTFVTVGLDKRVLLWDAATEKVIAGVLSEGRYSPRRVGLSPGGGRVAIPADRGVRVWELEAHSNIVLEAGHSIERVALSQEGRFLAASGAVNDGGLTVWEIASRAVLLSIRTSDNREGFDAVFFTADSMVFTFSPVPPP